MIMTSSVVEMKVERLLAVLDEDVRHLETTLAQLDALRGLLVKRDDAALDQLLGEIRGRTEVYAANEQMRQALRADLALALGCDLSRLTLSKLQSMLPDRHRAALAARQKKLASLIAELKREYALTAVLVSDCARFNRTLVRTLFGAASQVCVTYSPSGQARQPTNATLMSLQL
jgi:thiamine pyrophosphate-dependent acetolactate synthase large subunit-like protein